MDSSSKEKNRKTGYARDEKDSFACLKIKLTESRTEYGSRVREWFNLNLGERRYLDYLAGLRGYESLKELEKKWAGEKEFDSYYAYRAWLHGKSVRPQENEEAQMNLAPKDLDSIAVRAPLSEKEIEEAEIQEQKNKDLLKKFISQLPEKERIIITKIFYEGKTLGEISEEVGMTKEGTRQIEIRFLNRLAIDRRKIYSKKAIN